MIPPFSKPRSNSYKEWRRKWKEERKKREEEISRKYWERRRREKQIMEDEANKIPIKIQKLIEIAQRENFTFDETVQLFEVLTGDYYTRRTIRHYLRKYGIFGEKGRRRKVKNIPSHVLEEIKRLRNKGYGYRYISNRILKVYGISISHHTVWRLFNKYGIDKAIEEARKREEKAKEVFEFLDEFNKKSDEEFSRKIKVENCVIYGWYEYKDWYEKEEMRLVKHILKRFTVRQILLAYNQRKSEVLWRALIHAAGGVVRDVEEPLFRRVVLVSM